ncbi:DNA recombination protein RmuC [Sinomicrobium soli]|uniref:DNA recombination protein RmuC n=1 Tax=Sinomicrobium sp. N-1-3-6 TaxID=2219864 RepID=UPI000DCD2428|nr:DNA recombination protein RmuC [Sinomicrobium sp. N-1-3-6]RAV30377.1 DNA recombination protein RmuC [Sinomicrobium sp. N-1-3-6]
MDNSLLLLIIAATALIAGILTGVFLHRLRQGRHLAAGEERERALRQDNDRLQREINDLRAERTALQQEKENTGFRLVRREAELENLQKKHIEQKEETRELREKFTREFENLANRILEEKSTRFTQQNRENIKNILTPLHEKIQHFEKRVEDSQKESISIHSALREQLLQLQHQNLRITKEAENLTRALKGDSKMQGNWGELVLERVLEKSGLEKGREYEVQQGFTREDGSRVLPDVIIYLPDGKKMIVDSKVSLTAYERYVNAGEEQQESCLREHIASIRRHVEQLSAKRYEDLYHMESPDFVLMFIPIEPAFALAVNHDNTLYNRAFDKNIVIVTPSTLLATLRTIDTMWSNEKQQRNAVEIARQAGALYDKFEGLVTDLTRVGKKMEEAGKEYKGAMNKLVEGRGNIISGIEKLKKMGAKAKKSLPRTLLEKAEENEEKPR